MAQLVSMPDRSAITLSNKTGFAKKWAPKAGDGTSLDLTGLVTPTFALVVQDSIEGGQTASLTTGTMTITADGIHIVFTPAQLDATIAARFYTPGVYALNVSDATNSYLVGAGAFGVIRNIA